VKFPLRFDFHEFAGAGNFLPEQEFLLAGAGGEKPEVCTVLTPY
jgi:hypothetical protein